MSIKNIKIKIYGQVQGVFFRVNTEKRAKELGLFGFVKNEPDNTVLIEVEGPEGELKEFLDWCFHGEGKARVEKLEAKEGAAKGYSEFKIKH